jgi:hypothetical protein
VTRRLDVTVWPAGEFAAINTARIVGKADHEIRNLIARPEAAQIIEVLQREEARRPGFIAIHTSRSRRTVVVLGQDLLAKLDAQKELNFLA